MPVSLGKHGCDGLTAGKWGRAAMLVEGCPGYLKIAATGAMPGSGAAVIARGRSNGA